MLTALVLRWPCIVQAAVISGLRILLMKMLLSVRRVNAFAAKGEKCWELEGAEDSG